MGALGEPGPGVLPGVQGLATVADVPGLIVLEVVDPATVLDELVLPEGELVLVDGVELVLFEGVVELPMELVVPGVEVEVLEFPMLVPLLAGVHGATVFVVPERPVVVP
jgi:hypothetical protein